VEQIDLFQRAWSVFGEPVSPDTLARLSAYQDMLVAWNRKVNLISRNDADRIVTRHLLPSAGLARAFVFPPNCRVMDLGAGAGLPGIPLKLVRPDLRLILSESKRKKVHFLRRAVQELALQDVEIAEGRVEEILPLPDLVDVVVSRAVTDVSTLVQWSRRWLRSPGGQLVAVKGADAQVEVDTLTSCAAELDICRWEIMPYNPFPDIAPLSGTALVMVERGPLSEATDWD